MKNLSLYVHIPFCKRKCLYCDFLSAPASEEKINSYVNQLLSEIKEQSVFYGDHRVVSIFLGGGTPSLLSSEDTGRILRQIHACFSVAADAEVTLECNPGTATAGKLHDYITYGINRLSIGLQSTDDGELARIGRIHDYAAFLETYSRAKEAGFVNINIDLMAGLPGQSLDSYAKTLERVIALNPAHISAYSLILEEGTELYVNQSNYTFPDEEEDREMYRLTEACLKKAGFHRYEISNYARAGRECRHNKVYWQRGDYVGFGLGASSMVNNIRWKNPDTWQDYKAGAGRLEVQRLSIEEQMEEFMFLGLRLMEGVDGREFGRLFGRPLEAVYKKPIDTFRAQGLLEREGEKLKLTDRGIDVSNVVFASFLF